MAFGDVSEKVFTELRERDSNSGLLSELDNLDNATEKLWETLAILQERLGPLLKDLDGDRTVISPDSDPEDSMVSALTERVRRARQRVQGTTHRMKYLMENLDL